MYKMCVYACMRVVLYLQYLYIYICNHMRIRGGVPKRFIISSAADATSRSGSKGENSARVYAGEGGWGSDKNVLQRE